MQRLRPLFGATGALVDVHVGVKGVVDVLLEKTEEFGEGEADRCELCVDGASLKENQGEADDPEGGVL